MLRDAVTGLVVAVQRVSPDEIEFAATDIPALGHKSYSIEPANLGAPHASEDRFASSTPTKKSPSASTRIENSFYRVSVRPSDGAVTSIYDKQLQRELVDSGGDKAANQLLRWTAWSSLPVGLAQVADHVRNRPGLRSHHHSASGNSSGQKRRSRSIAR